MKWQLFSRSIFPACFLIEKVMFVLKIVHLWSEATPATYHFDETALSWSLLRVKTN